MAEPPPPSARSDADEKASPVPTGSFGDPNSGVEDGNDSTSQTGRKVTGLLWLAVLLSILSSTFLYALDNTVMANIRPGIIRSFGHLEMLQWITVAYPLGEVGSCPFWGSMYQRFNNKWLYVSTVLVFEIGSAVIGSARSMNSVIAGRIIAGIGGSGIYVGTVNIISIMTSSAERSQYLGFIGIAWSMGTILGPIVGGAFNDSSATWRWAFYINICIAGAAAPACLFLIPSSSPEFESKGLRRLKSFDYLGAILFAGGIACIIMILSFGGAIWNWSDGRMTVLYVCAGVAWFCFSLQQWKSLFTTHPIFPVHFIADREMSIMFCHTAIAISNLVVTIYMVPLFFQFVYGYSALKSGLFIFAVTVAGICAAGAGGAVFPKFSVYMVWYAAASAIALIGSALLATISSSTTRGQICGYATVQLIGCGVVVQLPFTAGQLKVQRKQIRSVTAFLTTAQMAGLAFSLGIATCVFATRAVDQITAVLPELSRSSLYAALGGAGSSIVDGLPIESQEVVLDIIARSIGRVFYLNVVSSAFGLLSSFVMSREKLIL